MLKYLLTNGKNPGFSFIGEEAYTRPLESWARTPVVFLLDVLLDNGCLPCA